MKRCETPLAPHRNEENEVPSLPPALSLGELVARTCFLVFLWWTPSIGLTFYNKWLFHARRFPLPLTATLISFGLNSVIAGVLRVIRARWTGVPLAHVSWNDYIGRVVPTAVVASADISLSNASFLLVTVSLYTMTKSTSIIFLLLFSFAFGLEKPTAEIAGITFTIAIGVFLFTYADTEVDLVGFTLVLGAAAAGGLRWVLVQVLMQRSAVRLGPLDVFYMVGPPMGIALAPFAYAVELRGHGFSSEFSNAELFGCVVLQAIIALGMQLAEFLLIQETSSMTFQVAGVMKEIATLTISTLFVHDKKLRTVNTVGMVLTVSGVALYNVFKLKRRRRTGFATAAAAAGLSLEAEERAGLLEPQFEFELLLSPKKPMHSEAENAAGRETVGKYDRPDWANARGPGP